MEVDVLGGHDGAGGILGIVKQLVNLGAGGGVGVAQDTADHVGGHVLDEVHGIVQVQLVQHLPQLLIAQGVDEPLLIVGVFQLGEHLGGDLLGQQTEDQNGLLRTQLVQKFGDVHLIHIVQQLPQAAELLGADQLQQLVQIIILVHMVSPSEVTEYPGRKTATGSLLRLLRIGQGTVRLFRMPAPERRIKRMRPRVLRRS